MSNQGEIGQDRIGMEADPVVLGSYKILRLLGQGGFARVYLGEHKLLDTVAAIKVLRLKVMKSLWQDFYDEAHTIAHLKHNNIVRVLDFGLEGNVPFLVMDYAQEGSLRQRHPAGSVLALNTILSYVQQVAAALHYAHSQNVVHCDVKPENLLVGDQQTILLSDFGLATVAQYRPGQIETTSQAPRSTWRRNKFRARRSLPAISTRWQPSFTSGFVVKRLSRARATWSSSSTCISLQRR